MTVATEPSKATARGEATGRLALQAGRRHERRRRLTLSLAGIGALVALLAVTVLVVDVIR